MLVNCVGRFVLVLSMATLPSCSKPTERGAKAEEDVIAVVGYDVRRLRPRNEERLEDMFERLFAQARNEDKRVAVLFSADWCEPCQVLDTELGNEHPEEMIGHVRILELKEEDWEAVTRMDEVNSLRARWHKTLDSYPVLVLLDAEGNKVEEMKEAISRLEAEGLEPTLPHWLATHRVSRG